MAKAMSWTARATAWSIIDLVTIGMVAIWVWVVVSVVWVVTPN